MRTLRFERLYLTHFDAVTDVDDHWDAVSALLPRYANLVRDALAAGQDRSAILASFSAWEEARLVADGIPTAEWPVYASLGPADMAVDGLMRFWHKQASAAS
jgi:hypothetical protein